MAELKRGRTLEIAYKSGVVYRGEIKDGKEHGRGIMEFPDGEVYEGEWKDGDMHGHGRIECPNGAVYEGEWKDGDMHGKGKVRMGGGYTWEGYFADGWPHGIGWVKQPGQVPYVEEKNHGKFVGYFDQHLRDLWNFGKNTYRQGTSAVTDAALSKSDTALDMDTEYLKRVDWLILEVPPLMARMEDWSSQVWNAVVEIGKMAGLDNLDFLSLDFLQDMVTVMRKKMRREGRWFHYKSDLPNFLFFLHNCLFKHLSTHEVKVELMRWHWPNFTAEALEEKVRQGNNDSKMFPRISMLLALHVVPNLDSLIRQVDSIIDTLDIE